MSNFSLLFVFNGVQEGFAVSDFQFRIYPSFNILINSNLSSAMKQIRNRKFEIRNPLTIHYLLNMFSLKRYIGHQINIVFVGDQNIVFQPDTQTFLPNINTRFTG
jgi:hypothetical protein